jgi:aminoglycoside phosphotransferase (APT) family kinase protein
VSADAVDARAALAAVGVREVDRVVPITSGQSTTAVFRVERGGERFALRVFPAGEHDDLLRECAAMDAARAGGVPVPEVVARGAWDERPVLVMGWNPGRMMLDEVRGRPWRAYALGRQLGRVQARIHAVDAPGGEPALERDWIGWAGPVDAALAARLAAIQRGRALLHLDLHPMNVLVAGGRISAVLDWANAAVGDPRADLARTWSLLRVAPSPPGVPKLVILPVRRAMEAGWRRGYRETAGWPADLAPFLAWAVEVMVNDLAPKLGRPGVWILPAHVEEVRQEAARWRQRADIA